MIANPNAQNADSRFDDKPGAYERSEPYGKSRQAGKNRKWPRIVRVFLILGLSLLFWAGIIATVRYLFF